MGQFGVNLVGEDDEIALNGDVGDALQLLAGEDDPGGIVRRVDDEQACAIGDGIAQGIDVGSEGRRS